jgi:flagellar protein FlbD
MISVTRLNGSTFWVSSEQIEFIESTPDTVVTLLSGKKVIIKESAEELIEKIIQYRRQLFAGPEILVDKRGKESSGREDDDR